MIYIREIPFRYATDADRQTVLTAGGRVEAPRSASSGARS
jgi:hypothetical protein